MEAKDTVPTFIAYGIYPGKGQRFQDFDAFRIKEATIPSNDSFFDFSGVVVFAGAFYAEDRGAIVCKDQNDLDRRVQESLSIILDNKPDIILVPRFSVFSTEQDGGDLFPALLSYYDIQWESFPSTLSITHTHATANEFKDYVKKYGSTYGTFHFESHDVLTTLVASDDFIFGATVHNSLFLLPCTTPQNYGVRLETAITAIRSVIAYRARVSKEMPQWAHEFRFGREATLRKRLDTVNDEAAKLTESIDSYTTIKGALVYQSDPLVDVVKRILDQFFGVRLTIDDRYIEDATLVEAGQIVAVFEVKGVKGSFKRHNVGQLDSHRERLKLPMSVPGVLIMNTLMDATTLDAKDQQPDPEIITKAVNDNVLMIRTLDLLRYADAVERGVLSKNDFLQTLLTSSGWMKVEGDGMEIVRQ